MIDRSWIPFQHQREQKMWRRWIWVVRNFHDSGVRLVSFSCERPGKAWYTTRYSFRCFLGLQPPWNGSPSYFEWKDDCSGSVPFEAGLIWLYSRWCQHQMGSSGCKLCPVWIILWSRDVIYIPGAFGVLFSVELHHLTDACEFDYGCVSYLRFTNQLGKVYLHFWQVTCHSFEANDHPSERVGCCNSRS